MHMLGCRRIHKARRLLHVDSFFKLAMKKYIILVEFPDYPREKAIMSTTRMVTGFLTGFKALV